MDAHAGPFAMAAGTLVAAAFAIARAGLRQRSHRGWPWWMAATLLGAGALLAAPAAAGTPIAERLLQAGLVAWAPMLLLGLRQFHARPGLPASARADAVVLAAGVAGAVWMPGAAVLGVQCYVATLMWRSRAPQDAGALRLLGAVVALLALPVALTSGSGAGGPLLAQAASAGLGLAVAAFVALTLMGERTERELRASRRRLRVLANIDPLTSVPNRRHFHELAQRAVREPDPNPPVLLVFDIDHFKLVNDRLGHAAGDRALQLVGRCLQDVLRARDVAGRLGGDEFALLLCGATLAQAMGVARRIVGQMQSQSPARRLPMLGLSFGLVQVQPDESVDAALRRADQALYEAKRQGRSCAVAADGDESQPAFSESERLGLTPV